MSNDRGRNYFLLEGEFVLSVPTLGMIKKIEGEPPNLWGILFNIKKDSNQPCPFH